MNPVTGLQNRASRVLRVAALFVLLLILGVMVRGTFGAGGTLRAHPASASPSSDKSHYDPFLPVQWLYVLDTRT
jgi:hypothetical protein